MHMPSEKQLHSFSATVTQFGAELYRPMPWRENLDPYWILVSEIMLQQTQVERVIPKFEQFIQAFPDIQSLSEAKLGEVITAWLGLGYNRRAKFLHQSAQIIVSRYNSTVPNEHSSLVELPGIGPNTAGAIMAYAYNARVIYIETNIRAVYLHHFFSGEEEVSDNQILPLLESTVPDKPREWYWALMDYGSHLKNTLQNPSRRSKHHSLQSQFEGSKRQVRGRVLAKLVASPLGAPKLHSLIPDARLTDVLSDLQSEGLISYKEDIYSLSDSKD